MLNIRFKTPMQEKLKPNLLDPSNMDERLESYI